MKFMQTKTKTNKNRTAPIEAAQTQKTRSSCSTKKTVSTPTAKTTEANASCSWLKSNTSRPKTLFVQMQRTANGYTIKEATVLSPINQHASKRVPVSVRAVTEDINRRGIII
jgi:hypothetical protein